MVYFYKGKKVNKQVIHTSKLCTRSWPTTIGRVVACRLGKSGLGCVVARCPDEINDCVCVCVIEISAKLFSCQSVSFVIQFRIITS